MANVGMPSGAFGVCVTVSNHEMVFSPFLSSSFFYFTTLCVCCGFTGVYRCVELTHTCRG